MYSKPLLKKTVDRQLKALSLSYYRLSKVLSISQSNLSRALDSEAHNLTLPQFSILVEFLQLTEDEVFSILIPKKKPPTVLPTVRKKLIKK